MGYIIGIVWTAFDTAVILLFTGAFLQQKKKPGIFILILAIAVEYALAICQAQAYITKPIQIAFTFFPYFLLIRYLYCGNLLPQVLIVIIAVGFVAVMEALFVAGTSAILEITYSALVERRLTYVVIVTASRAATGLIAWILYRFRSKGDIGAAKSKWIVLTLIFPLVCFAILMVTILNYQKDADIGVEMVVFGVMLGIANILLICIIDAMEKSIRRGQELRLLRQRIDLQAKNFSALEDSYRQQRQSAHEFQRHINALCGLLERGEYGTALDYVKKVQSDRSIRNTNVVSKNPIIDVVLNREYTLALEQRIKMLVKVSDLSALPLGADDLVVLLSNLLDNAIEACQRCDGEKEIRCNILWEETLYISIRNTSPPVIINSGMTTSKPDKSEHGYGLPAIKYILGELGAEYTFEYADGWFSFAAEIPC